MLAERRVRPAQQVGRVGAVKVGTKTVNVNRRGAMFWPTTSTITALDAQKKLSFRVNTNNTEWTYDLEPSGTGTKVTVSRHAEAVKPISSTLINRFMGGVPNFEVELVEGMKTSLGRIKAAAEGA